MTNPPPSPFLSVDAELKKQVIKLLELPIKDMVFNSYNTHKLLAIADSILQLITAHDTALLERVESEVIGKDLTPKKKYLDETKKQVAFANLEKEFERNRLATLREDVVRKSPDHEAVNSKERHYD